MLRIAGTFAGSARTTVLSIMSAVVSRSTASTKLSCMASNTPVASHRFRKHRRPLEGEWQFVNVRFDPHLLERHDAWRRQLSERQLPAMHLGLSRVLSQQRLRVVVRNVGPISAELLSLEVRSGNATLHATPYRVLVLGASPPRDENPMMRVNRLVGSSLRPHRRNEPFTVHREQENLGPVLSWSCQSFRQERALTIDLSVELEGRTGPRVEIEAVVTARNLKGDVRARALVPVEQSRPLFSEIFDVERGAFVTMPVYLPIEEGKDDEITRFYNDGSSADQE